MDFYQKFLAKQLGNKINSKLPADKQIDVNDVDAVMANISVLAEKVDKIEFGAPTGEYYTYLPKEDKMTVLRLISLTAALDSGDPKWEKVNDKGEPISRSEAGHYILRASASLYFDRNDTRPIATYAKTYELDRLLGEGVTYETATIEQRSNAEGLVRGIVETRCLSKFGIGEWYGNENDPEMILAQKDNSSANIGMPEMAIPQGPVNTPAVAPVEVSEPVQMEIPFEMVTEAGPATVPETETHATTTEKKTRTRRKKEEPAPVEAPAEQAVESPTTDEVKTESVPEQIVTSISLEEAKTIKATVGLAATKGYTLGDIANDERMKMNNLRYIYTHSHNPREKEGIRVIALNDAMVMESFTQEGISLE